VSGRRGNVHDQLDNEPRREVIVTQPSSFIGPAVDRAEGLRSVADSRTEPYFLDDRDLGPP
jgi:hypothetical protein